MEIKPYITEIYQYNYWANKRYLAVAETLTQEQLFHKHGHSWESVHAILVHMMSSEQMWPQRWRGEQIILLDAKDFPTAESILNTWLKVEENILAFLANQSDESLQKPTSYTNPKGETFTLPLWQMMAHVPNHNTHHRGELAAMFALMNIAHPEEEVVQYFLNASGQKKF